MPYMGPVVRTDHLWKGRTEILDQIHILLVQRKVISTSSVRYHAFNIDEIMLANFDEHIFPNYFISLTFSKSVYVPLTDINESRFI